MGLQLQLLEARGPKDFAGMGRARHHRQRKVARWFGWVGEDRDTLDLGFAGSVHDRVDGQEIRLSRSAQGLCLPTYAERQRAGHVGGAGEQAAARVLVRQRAAILERHAH